MAKGTQTRERIMDIAETAILQKGFDATSIDELIAEAEITKSGFFYHFPDKTELARALMRRHLDRDDVIFDDLFGRAAELTDDPLHGFLVGLKLFAEMMADLPEGHPGCLVVTYCYNERLFDGDIRQMTADGVLSWRRRFRRHLDAIAENYPPKEPVDLDALADMLSSTVEGSIVMSKVLADQILMYRNYIKGDRLVTLTSTV